MKRALRVLEAHRDHLVLSNLRLVLKEVFRYPPVGMRRTDLFQDGVLGLQKAAFRYDAKRGIRFSTYATCWIRQSIRKALIDRARMIRVPQGTQARLRKGSLTDPEAQRVHGLLWETVLFSSGETTDDRPRFEIEDTNAEPLKVEHLRTEHIPEVIRSSLHRLNENERNVVQRRFGLDGSAPQTLEEIGRHLSLSRERIRQIETKALTRMREFTTLKDVYEELDALESAGTIGRN